MMSPYKNCEAKCALPSVPMNVALVKRLDAIAQGGNAGKPDPGEHPGPSPGTWNGPAGVLPDAPAVVPPTANAEALRIESVFLQFSTVTLGVVMSGPKLNVPDTCPPTANESPALNKAAFRFSVNSNCMACTVTFFKADDSKSHESFSLNPSGVMSGSIVN